MNFDENSFVVLYSHIQKAFQIETVATMIKTNLEAYAKGNPIDWVVMNIVENKDAASKLVDTLRTEQQST